MALVEVDKELTVQLVDNGGNVTTKRYQMRAALIADCLTDALIVLSALAAVTNSVISGYRVASVFQEDSFAFPAAGIENEDKASVTVLLSTGTKKANFKIPAPVIGLFQATTGPGANIVDVLDGQLNTYHNIFQSDGEVYISDGEDSLEPLSGKRISAKNNNG